MEKKQLVLKKLWSSNARKDFQGWTPIILVHCRDYWSLLKGLLQLYAILLKEKQIPRIINFMDNNSFWRDKKRKKEN